MKKSLATKAVKRINAVICALPNYHNEIPLGTIFSVMEENGLVALQEDGTRWDGLLCGTNEHASFAIGSLSDPVRHDWGTTYAEVAHMLEISWYRMSSGRYEIVTYIS